MLAKVKKASMVDYENIKKMLEKVPVLFEPDEVEYFILEQKELVGIIGIQATSQKKQTAFVRPVVVSQNVSTSQLIEFLGAVLLHSEKMGVEQHLVMLHTEQGKELFELYDFEKVDDVSSFDVELAPTSILLQRNATIIEAK